MLLGAAALLPGVAAANTMAAVETASDAGFDPPAAPMILTRTLRRPFPDGKEVLTRRSYEIHFRRDGDGFRIDGELISTEVEAPPDLAMLAALERVRPDTGMFPMRLDRAGSLRRLQEPDPRDNEQVRAGAAVSGRMLDAAMLDPAERAQASAFVRQLAESTARTQWPQDLFRPRSGYHREERAIPIEGGGTGNVIVEREAVTGTAAGLLTSFARTVTTDLGGDIRKTYEVWNLRPKP